MKTSRYFVLISGLGLIVLGVILLHPLITSLLCAVGILDIYVFIKEPQWIKHLRK